MLALHFCDFVFSSAVSYNKTKSANFPLCDSDSQGSNICIAMRMWCVLRCKNQIGQQTTICSNKLHCSENAEKAVDNEAEFPRIKLFTGEAVREMFTSNKQPFTFCGKEETVPRRSKRQIHACRRFRGSAWAECYCPFSASTKQL